MPFTSQEIQDAGKIGLALVAHLHLLFIALPLDPRQTRETGDRRRIGTRYFA